MEEKIKVSAIIKTKNNENKLCETLESIKDFDEIIVIDEHSTDDTVEFAKEYKAKIIYADKNDLTIAQNQALSEARNEWIFILEENEIIPQKLIREIQNYILNPKKNKNCVAFHQKFFYMNKEIKAARTKDNLRLFKKDFAEFKNDFSMELNLKAGKIHRIKPNSKNKNAYILKFSYNDIAKYIIEIIDKNRNILKKSNKITASIFLAPIGTFLYWYILKGAMMDGKRGFIFSIEKGIQKFLLETMFIEKGCEK